MKKLAPFIVAATATVAIGIGLATAGKALYNAGAIDHARGRCVVSISTDGAEVVTVIPAHKVKESAP